MDNTSKTSPSVEVGVNAPESVGASEAAMGMKADAPEAAVGMTAGAPEAAVSMTAGAQIPISRIVLRWVLVVAMAAFIFYMSSRTAGQLGTGIFAQIKAQCNDWLADAFGLAGDPMSVVAHFCEYLVFGVLLVNALRSHMPLKRALVGAIVCASAYGVTDEIHQIFVDGRYCDAADWLTDTLGATLGASGLFGIFAAKNK